MTDPRALDVLVAVHQQLAELVQRQAAQDAALLTLARHLAARGHADLPVLVQELRTMATVQPDAGWQAGLKALAGALRRAHVP